MRCDLGSGVVSMLYATLFYCSGYSGNSPLNEAAIGESSGGLAYRPQFRSVESEARYSRFSLPGTVCGIKRFFHLNFLFFCCLFSQCSFTLFFIPLLVFMA